MVDPKNMTPEQAMKYLEKQHKRAHERQRAYVKKQAELGRKRVSVYITADAAQFLRDEVERTGKRAADVVSDALMMMSKHSRIVPASRSQQTVEPVSVNRSTHEDYDEEAVMSRISELRLEQGMSWKKVADTLNEEGIVTQTGVEWTESNVKKVGAILKGR